MRMLAALVTVIPITLMADPPPAPEPATLAGPRVDGLPTGRRTLVHREFDGRLKRLEVEPVGAAVAIMDLSASDRAAAERVLLERKTAFDALIRDNIPLLMRADGAFKGHDGGEGQRALQQLFEKARPIIDRGPLIDQVAGALSPGAAAELRRIHAEYMAAAVQDRIDRGEKPDRFGLRLAEGFAQFQREVEDSARRVFEGGEKEFKQLAARLDLTPEQESRIQGMFQDLYANSMGKPPKGEQARVLLKSLGLLTPEQKVKLREIIAQEARDAARAKRRAGSGPSR
ncbi:MAG: hypothetical protein ACK4WH_08955 [Phycisphaerales bacterium]